MAKTNFTPAQRVLKKYEQFTVDALRLSGEFVAGQAKLLAPVDTGFLRGSITYALKGFVSKVDTRTHSNQSRNVPKSNRVTQEDAVSKPTKKFVVRIGTAAEYAAEIEFGTHTKGSARGGFGALNEPSRESKGRRAKSFLRGGLALSRRGIRQIFRKV